MSEEDELDELLRKFNIPESKPLRPFKSRPNRGLRDRVQCTPGHKICFKCMMQKKVEEFSKCARRKDGLQDWCKDCLRSYARIPKNRERAKEKLNREKARERCRAYYRRNREKILAQRKGSSSSGSEE